MPDVRNPAQAGLLTKVTTVTAAQIAALSTTAATLVPAPGVGNIILPFAAGLVYNFGTVGFLTTGVDTLTFQLRSGATLTAFTNLSGFMNSGASAYMNRVALVSTTNQAFLPGIDNLPLLLGASTNYNAGPIATATINAAGTGYAVNDTGTINGGTADATYQITSIGAAGAVTGFSITSGGTKYATGSAIATTNGGAQPGIGVGFKVNIVTVTTGDGTLKVTTYYTIVPVP